MAVRNKHWYNANEARAYPVDEQASGLDDAGTRLPDAIITDLVLRFPRDLGEWAFLGAVAVTPGLVTVVIQASDDPDGGVDPQPLATVSVPRQGLDEGRLYPLDAQQDGVGGWIAFGSGVRAEYNGRFASPVQSLLVPRAARAYRALPVRSLGALEGDQGLDGQIRLRGEAPMQIVSGTRVISGTERQVAVLQLTQPPDERDTILQKFLGPCGGRPESRTCGEPEPLEFINTVAPDCDGVVTIELTGCARLGVDDDGHGFVIDCDIGLGEACPGKRLPDSTGQLPGDEDDQCA